MSDAIETVATPAPLRPWYRLHLSTWLVLIFGLIAAAALNVPGNDVHDLRLDILDNYEPGAGSERTFLLQHGWPMTYSLCEVNRQWLPQKIASSDVWDPISQMKQFHLWALIVDGALALAAIAAVVIAFEIRRRRTRRLQFRLRTLMIAMTLAAIAFGWLRSERRDDGELRAHLTALDELPVSRLPLWIRTAIGEENAAALGLNEPPALCADWGPDSHADIKYLIERFPARVHLHRQGGISEDDWQKISELTNLEAMSILYVYGHKPTDLFNRLKTFKHLRFLVVGLPGRQQCYRLTATESVQICKLASLEHLSVVQCGFTSQGLESLGSMPHLRTLAIDSSIIDQSSIVVFGRLHQLSRLDVWGGRSDAAQLEAKLQQLLPQCQIFVNNRK